MSNRPSRQEIFARDLVERLGGRIHEIKDKTISAALHQADIMTRQYQPKAYHGGGAYYPGSGDSHYRDSRSGGAQWPYGVANRGMARTLNHRLMLMNGRDAYHDSVQARSIVSRKADNTAGVGLRVEPTPIAAVLGITPEAAQEWGRDVGYRHDLYMRDKKQNRSETMTGYQSQHFYITSKERDNDVFTRLYYSADRGLQNPLQFEFIDPTQIRGDAITNTGFPYYKFDDGIERDDRGREQAYKIWIVKADKTLEAITVPAKGPKSKRRFMLHGFTPEYAGQARGYSPLGFAIQKFENITDLEASHIKKAIQQSSIFMTNENADLDPGDPTLGVDGGHDAGPSQTASEYGASAEPSTEALNVDPHVLRMQGAEIREAGSVIMIAPQRGDKLKPFAGMAPADSFDKFVDSFTAHLSAATGMPIEVLLMRFNQNYSASRATLILFWRKVVIDREEMAADYLNPHYEMWLSEEIAAGRIQAPGWSDPVLRAAWLNCAWVGMPLPDIDPSKTAKAAEIRTALGHQTGKRGAREFNGSDFDVNAATIESEYGERPPMPGQGGGNGGNPDNEKQED
jgi:capsid protein